MKRIETNHSYEWWLGACDEFKQSMSRIGIEVSPVVNKGCHWGQFYAFDEELEKLNSLMNENFENDNIKALTIKNKHRSFHITHACEPFGYNSPNKFFFSIYTNK